MAEARQTNSRAKEFDLVFGFLNSPEKLAYQISRSPTGANLKLEGINFEYGNVSRLAEHLDASTPTRPFKFKVKYVCHLDGIKAARKKVIEREYGLDSGSISSQETKADLLIIDKQGKHYFISVKDPDKPSKMGQKSGSVSYGKAKLHGGLKGVALDERRIPKSFSYEDTQLDKNQFTKATRSDQIFAFFKENQPKEWNEIVTSSEKRALVELRRFADVLKDDHNSLIKFISETMGGNLQDDPNFYIVSGESVVNLAAVVKAIKKSQLRVTLKDNNPRGKVSIIVRIEIKNKIYCLTKIEPSFEGKKANVSQTKGIIYHFQHYQDDNNDWKKLFLDVLK